jgi:hypothetical protein
MPDLPTAIARLRAASAAVMKITPTGQADANGAPQFNVSMVGSAWCVAAGRYFVSAFHILNGGQPRDPNDRFVLFLVPDNGPQAFHFPVLRFVLEDAANDYLVLEIDPGAGGIQAEPLPITLDPVDDGVAVATIGFPSPEIHAGQVDAAGNWLGGQFFLKSHANSGIVSAHYEAAGGVTLYEVNVGWHHGESGGPVARVDPLAVFSLMQHYRNVQTPFGTVAGPHRGVALSVIAATLRNLGATII